MLCKNKCNDFLNSLVYFKHKINQIKGKIMNKVYLIGNLTRDPELSETPSGVAVCKFGIAINRNYANAEGKRDADFFNVVVWRSKAENCAKYLTKGSKVAIEGTIQIRSYQDKDDIKRYVTEIIAEDVEFLSKAEESKTEQPKKLELQPTDEDLPF